MQLQQLRTFTRVVETGSLTRAALQLALTQPAVTKQLLGLERDLDCKLLWRRGRRLHLTPAGELLYGYARRITTLVEQAEDAVANLDRPGHGTVRLGAVSMVSTTVLPRVLAHFGRHYPAVQVHVETGEVQDNVDRVLSHGVDLAVVTVPIMHPRIVSLPLAQDDVVLVAATATAARWPKPLPLARLADLSFVSYQAPSRFRSFVDGMLERQGMLLRVMMEFNTHEGVRSMVRLGLGAAFMPFSVVEEDVRAGALAVIPVVGLAPMSRVTSLILPVEGHANPALTALVESFGRLFPLEVGALPEWLRG